MLPGVNQFMFKFLIQERKKRAKFNNLWPGPENSDYFHSVFLKILCLKAWERSEKWLPIIFTGIIFILETPNLRTFNSAGISLTVYPLMMAFTSNSVTPKKLSASNL